jgi:hypothetical protein
LGEAIGGTANAVDCDVMLSEAVEAANSGDLERVRRLLGE